MNGSVAAQDDVAELVVFEVFDVGPLDLDADGVRGLVGLANAFRGGCQFLVRQHPVLQRSVGGDVREDGVWADMRYYMVFEAGDGVDVTRAVERMGWGARVVDGSDLDGLVDAAMGGRVLGGTVSDRSGVTAAESYLRMGDGRYGRVMELAGYFRVWGRNIVSELLSLGIEFDLSLQLRPFGRNEAVRLLVDQQRAMERNLARLDGSDAGGYAKVVVGLEDVARVRGAIMRGEEWLFDTALTVAVFADDEGMLDDNSWVVRRLCEASLARVDELKGSQLDGMVALLPVRALTSSNWVVGSGESLAPLFPIVQERR